MKKNMSDTLRDLISFYNLLCILAIEILDEVRKKQIGENL